MKRVPIFYYHSIGGPPPQTLPLPVFRRHLELLRAGGVTTVTVADAVRGATPDGPCAVLTFDDGLLDNYENALPLLLEFGFCATFYVVPGYDRMTRYVHPGSGRWSDVPRAGYVVPFRSMQAAQRRELVACGMEIGSHSYTHRALTRVPPADLRREVAESRAFLQDELGTDVVTFCYPKGRFNRAVMAAVRAAGYEAACSTLPGYFRARGSRFMLNRFLVENPLYFGEVLRGRAFHPTAWPLSWLRWRR